MVMLKTRYAWTASDDPGREPISTSKRCEQSKRPRLRKQEEGGEEEAVSE
jgi:hypothetical protein